MGGVLFGGAWSWAALITITLGAAVLDVMRYRPNAPHKTSGSLLLALVGASHFSTLLLVLARIPDVPLAEALPLALAAALAFGQISHPAAHEMIHNSARPLRHLGRAVYGSLLLGHHASAHMRVHHVHVGTDQDPNSAPRGMGFYRFFLRAWIGSFLAGAQAETTARRRQSPSPHWLTHPYVGHFLWAALTLSVAGFSGPFGLIACLGICLYAQAQVFLADYVQHYGLRRAIRSVGKPEPVGPQHSWNAPHWYSAAMMLNAPRHSHHHMAPRTPFPALELTPQMPTLPYSLPVMAVIALVPPVWRRLMARQINQLGRPRSQ
nr:alkane 1-monooxygenase [Tritonibacter litoralis]